MYKQYMFSQILTHSFNRNHKPLKSKKQKFPFSTRIVKFSKNFEASTRSKN